MTANSTFLNIGVAPSQIAQADIPKFQYFSSLGRCSLFAVAPVAITIVWVLISLSSDRTVNGRLVKSTEITSSVYNSAPQRTA